MKICECGCGKETKREFVAGHDQRLRTALEHRVGGILPLRSLVELAEASANGEMSNDSFSERVREVLSRNNRLG